MKENKGISIRSFISLNNKVMYRTKFVARLAFIKKSESSPKVSLELKSVTHGSFFSAN